MQGKYTLESFKVEAVKVHGTLFDYVEVIYGQGRGKIHAICKSHGPFISDIKNHLNGSGCIRCRAAKLASISEAGKLTLEVVRNRASELYGDRFQYLSVTKEKGEPAVVAYLCPVHGERTQNVHTHLRKGSTGCKPCGSARRADAQKYTKEQVAELGVQTHGNKYSYDSVEACGGRTYVIFTCPEHGVTRQAVKAHIKGAGCNECGRLDAGLKYRHTLADYIEKARAVHPDSGYEYAGIEYINARAFVSYECPKHGTHRQDASGHLLGKGCPSCRGVTTKPCLEVVAALGTLAVTSDLEFRFEGSRKPFDIAVHSARLVVEYNGNYWHSSEWIHSSKHLEKSRLAEANGYRCIQIRSDEWANKRTAVEYLLKSAAGKVAEKVYARKTQIVRPSKVEASLLLDTYHIQGSVLQGEFYGLEEAGQLVAVMVFSRNTSSRREKASDSHVELTRYVTCKQVVGGFTKLLNHFLKENPQVKTIASYSDVRIFQGGVYEKAGFAKMHTTPPDYMYLEGDTLYHKANYQKSKLAKRFGAEACEGKTERQITEEQGIYRIYDCGKTKWLYTRK